MDANVATPKTASALEQVSQRMQSRNQELLSILHNLEALQSRLLGNVAAPIGTTASQDGEGMLDVLFMEVNVAEERIRAIESVLEDLSRL